MALATTTTPGSIILGGDLTGVANAPELRITGVTAGTYAYPTIVVDAKGRTIFASSGASSNGTVSGDFTGDIGTATLVPSGVGAAAYTRPSFTVNSKGLITSATAGALPPDLVRSPSGWGVSGPYTNAVLQTTGITQGSYTYATITVNAYGFITAVSSGTAPSAAYLTATYTSDASPTKGIIQVQSSAGLTLTSGALAGTLASTSTAGFIKSGTSNITITNGVIDIGGNVIKLTQQNTLSAATYEAIAVSSSSITPVLADYSLYNINATVATINNPSSLTSGQVIDFAYSFPGFPSYTWLTNHSPTNVIWNGTRFIAVDRHYTYPSYSTTSSVLTSSDGTTWTSTSLSGGTAQGDEDLFFGSLKVASKGNIVVVIDSSQSTTGYISTSSGAPGTFSSFTLPSAVEVHSHIFASSSFFIITFPSSTQALISTNGSTWTTTTLPAVPAAGISTILDGAANGTTLVLTSSVIGGAGTTTTMTSSDGVNWSTSTLTQGDNGQIAHNGSVFCIFAGNTGSGYRTYISSDGINWGTFRNTYLQISATNAENLFVFDGIFHVPRGSNVFKSSDGVNWSEVEFYKDSDGGVWHEGVQGGTIRLLHNNLKYSIFSDATTPTLSFGSAYKFSNTIPTNVNSFTINCVTTSSAVYCTYNS